MEKRNEADLAELLTALRRGNRQQSGLESRLTPPNNETAYRIAGIVAENLEWRVGGWKIAATKPEMQQALRTDAPIYGRVFEQHILPSPATFAFSNLALFRRSSIKPGSARIYRRERQRIPSKKSRTPLPHFIQA